MTTLTIPTETITTTILVTISAITTATVTKTSVQNITTTIIPEGSVTAAANLQQILEFTFSIIITIIFEGAICICIRNRAIRDARRNRIPPEYVPTQRLGNFNT